MSFSVRTEPTEVMSPEPCVDPLSLRERARVRGGGPINEHAPDSSPSLIRHFGAPSPGGRRNLAVELVRT
jgi:hypothetical protein